MQISDIQNPAERKKLFIAAGLGLVAIVLLWWTFFGFGSSSTTKPPRPVAGTATPTQTSVTSTSPTSATPPEATADILARLTPISLPGNSAPSVADPKRNIFAYYEPPVAPAVAPSTPTPTPTPTPPVLLASVSPASVFARTGNFTLEVSGDKFTPQLRIVIDNGELPTRYISPQQLSATVPASLIANSGSHQVMVRSNDGKLYSNSTAFVVNAPPTPNYTYVGIIGTQRYIDTAILQDRGSKEMLNVQRGDLLGGRFRVTSISEKELVLIDNNLKIKHTLPFSVSGDSKGNPLQRPTPRVESDDDQP